MPKSFTLNRRRLLQGGAATLAFAAMGPGCAPAESASIDVLTFPGTYNLLIWAAQDQGFFAQEGLDIAREPTTTSMYLIESVNSGTFPIGTSSIDNVVGYNEGQGAVDLERPPALFSFLNVQRNMAFPLVVTPEIASVADLAGKDLAVDAVSTGFSFVLREILRVHGLGADDYRLVSVGNARDRLESLKAGEQAGAILTPPFDRQAQAAGLKILATSRDAFEQYQGTTFITSRYWADANEEALVGFTKAILRSFSWLDDPANTEAAAAILAANIDGIDAAQAGGAVTGLRGDLSPDFNIAGIETVLRLRSRYGRPQKELTDPQAYLDTRYLETARRAL